MVNGRQVTFLPDAGLTQHDCSLRWRQDVRALLTPTVNARITLDDFVSIADAVSRSHGLRLARLPRDGGATAIVIRVSRDDRAVAEERLAR
jgi:hypothetical protein